MQVLVGASVVLWAIGLRASFAEAGGLKIAIIATVQKHASLKVLTQPLSVVVPAANIVRAYVDVPAPASVQVRSNTQDGHLLMFEIQGEFMRQTVVKVLTNDVQIKISAAGGGEAQNSAGGGMRQAQRDLGFLFLLENSPGKAFISALSGFQSRRFKYHFRTVCKEQATVPKSIKISSDSGNVSEKLQIFISSVAVAL